MKFKMIVFALALLFAGALVCSAQDPNMGTWKLNEAKSKFAKGAQKNHTVVYELSGDMVKVTVDGTTAVGNAAHNEWTESLMANTMRSLMIRHPVRVHTEESTAAHVHNGKERG